MRFAAITLCVASQRVFIVVVYFVIDSVRKILDTPTCFIFRNVLTISAEAFGGSERFDFLSQSQLLYE